MTQWLIPLLAGAATGILSGSGVGGGSLLLIYMTAFAGLPQAAAQGINLLYFLPAAGASLPAHFRHGLVEKRALLPAVSAGLAGTALTSWAATSVDTDLLRSCFGVFLLIIGIRELFRKETAAD